MKDVYVTITGMKFYLGTSVFYPGMILECKKEFDNIYDSEAIRVTYNKLGDVGYIANSTYTVARGTNSAGFIYNFVKNRFFIEVMFITNSAIVARITGGLKSKDRVYKDFINNLNNHNN